jgi:hypothetical protein
VPNPRTMVTEVGTGLGMLGLESVDHVLATRPSAMRNLSPEDWDQLSALRSGGAFDAEFHAAWENGRAFLAARDGLRGREPLVVEWKGGVRASGDEVAPVDLRIDHVYLVSCKYLSNILFNVSPSHVFDELLLGGSARRRGPGPAGGGDWYAEVAGSDYQALYEAVRQAVTEVDGDIDIDIDVDIDVDGTGWTGPPRSPRLTRAQAAETLPGLGLARPDDPGQLAPVSSLRELPARASDLTKAQRAALSDHLKSGWPGSARGAYRQLSEAVAPASALRWRQALSGASGSASAAAEAMLWRLLRMGSAPYFVLGSSATQSLRLRIATPWDWRQHYKLTQFEIFAQEGGQPRVGWLAHLRAHATGHVHEIAGHVEVRWSHGRFGGPPEAKGYLDTPHHLVPGYVPLQ